MIGKSKYGSLLILVVCCCQMEFSGSYLPI